MSRHLVLVALGPVQEFIAQARRTRDLWYGSHLLSELGRAAARAFVECKADLVFPALAAGSPELVECQAPLRPAMAPSSEGSPPLSIANKILAELDLSPGEDPAVVVRKVREQVWTCWRAIAERAWRRCEEKKVLAAGVRDAWDEQVETFPEFVAAWTPLGAGPHEFRDARTRVEAAIAGRKNLREFGPWNHQRHGSPKSSLDGARSSVLGVLSGAQERPFRIGRGEALDAVGLVKRAGGDPEQFVPIGNVALAAWIERAAVRSPEAVAKLRHACGQSKIGRVSRSGVSWTTSFPFDAQVFLRDRWEALLDEAGRPGEGRAWGDRYVAPVLSQSGDPFPYVACLVADGDRMGATLDSMGSPAAHREFSAKLSGFAQEARGIIERDHRGILVYAGGDDVLAFVCLSDALACARALAHRFDAIVREALGPGGGSSPSTPSLSVGLGVGHLLESMGELLRLGRDAEKLAKGSWLKPHGRDRNALAMVIDKRSGGRHVWRARWDDYDGDPTGRLVRDAELLGGELSTKKVYEVRAALLRSTERNMSPVDAGARKRILSAEVRRILGRTHASGGVEPEEVGLPLDSAPDYDSLHRLVLQWVERMLVARTIARGSVKSTGAQSPTSPTTAEAAANV